MSAFMVSDSHIDALISLARYGPKGADPQRDHWDGRFDWYGDDGKLGTLDHTNADEIGAMLIRENVASLEARYPGDAATLVGCDPASAGKGYRFPVMAPKQTVAEGMKAIACFEYQACEHAGWSKSSAAAFCRTLRDVLCSRVPGYHAAPWAIPDRASRNDPQPVNIFDL